MFAKGEDQNNHGTEKKKKRKKLNFKTNIIISLVATKQIIWNSKVYFTNIFVNMTEGKEEEKLFV